MKYISPYKLSKILGVDNKAIHQLIQRGKIKVVKIPKVIKTWYLIPIDEAKRIIRLTKAYRRGKELVG